MTSTAVVEFVYARTNAVSVRGNNEAKILHDESTRRCSSPSQMPRIASAVVSWDDAMAVHAGIGPRVLLSTHDADDRLEMRSVPPGNGYDGPFWFEQPDQPLRVFSITQCWLTPSSAIGLSELAQDVSTVGN